MKSIVTARNVSLFSLLISFVKFVKIRKSKFNLPLFLYNKCKKIKDSTIIKTVQCFRSYMFALFVLLIFSLVLAVVLGDVGSATSQVSQQVLNQECRFTGLLGHADIEVCWPVSWDRRETKLNLLPGNNGTTYVHWIRVNLQKKYTLKYKHQRVE